MNRASLQRAAIAIALVLVCAALLAWRTLAPQLSVPQPAFVPVPEKATRESAAPVEPARAERVTKVEPVATPVPRAPQEVVTRGQTNHRHSPAFTFEEYQWLDLPYCHQLPFADFHQWEMETRNPNVFSGEFADWCDYVARSQCARLANDPKLIGYFYLDCPTWVHTRPGNEWKGPMCDPQRLTTDAGRAELRKLATQYYRVTHDAIRRYDGHHLILSDRYEANAPLPVEVVEAAAPFVDVLSFQDFKDP